MTASFLTFVQQLNYLYNHLTVGQAVDITLTALVFFIAFQTLYQRRALQLLRGVVIAAILGGGLIMLMPLATLGWLARVVLLAGAIALPILFQDELRWALVGLGQVGRRRSYGSDYERFKHTLIVTLNQLAALRQGALIVLEGQTSLEEIIATGIRLQAGVVTPELLQTIFFPNTPLHDGAVVMRGDRLAAAGCILPVQTESTGEVHLGTRHRAALGLSSKAPDALALVVSEESGHISVAWDGKLHLNLSLGELESWLERFGAQPLEMKHSRWRWLRGGGLRSTLVNILTSILLALIAWLVVVYQTNPPGQTVLQGVPLTVSGPAAGMLLTSELPAAVNVELQTTRDRLSALSASSVRAGLDLLELSPGVHSVPLQVIVADPLAQVLSVSPASLDVTLEEELTRALTPTISIADLSLLPAGYVVGEPTLAPQSILVSGPRSLVERVTAARIDLAIGERRADFQESLTPLLLDDAGETVAGARLTPGQVVVTLPLRRTSFTRQVGVQAALDEQRLEAGYEIRSVTVQPTVVTLAGPQSLLSRVDSFLVTAPISLTRHFADFSVDAPLNTPAGLVAMDETGRLVQSVRVTVAITPVNGYLVLEQEVRLLNALAGKQTTVQPGRVSVLLIGPQMLLDEIGKQPQMIRVQVNLAGLLPGIYTLPLATQAPAGVQVQLFPQEVQVEIK